MRIRDIDVNFDFTSDTKGFWEGFWERNDGLGAGGADPIPEVKRLDYIVSYYGVSHYLTVN